MCIIQCLFAVVVLSIGSAHSWDIALTAGSQLDFYNGGNKTQSESVQFRDLTALAYDAVHNMLLFVDKQSDNASIFSFHLATKEYQPLVRKKAYEDIQGLAFDPVKSILFWTDLNERSIYWLSMKPGSKNNAYGNLLIKMDDELPRAIAVDSCRGYIYWTNKNVTKPTIERSRFDGSERTVIVSSNIHVPESISIDQRTKRLYWADDREGIHYSIESSDLDGNDRQTLVVEIYHEPHAITVSKDSIYWIDGAYKTVWKLPKNAAQNITPTELITFGNDKPFGIVANYKIEDQALGANCVALMNLAQNNTVINDSFNVPTDIGLFCVHGTKVQGKQECKCKLGYTGDRCDVSVCQYYCFQGDCSAMDGQPKCACKSGYTGERCEVNACHNFCLNNGACFLNEGAPECSCVGDFEGQQCERPKVVEVEKEEEKEKESFKCKNDKTGEKCEVNACHNFCLNNGVCSLASEGAAECSCVGDFVGKRCERVKFMEVQKENESCNCTLNRAAVVPVPQSSDTERQSTNDYILYCGDGWDTVRDPVIIALGILCGTLFLACAVLTMKTLHLTRRPRIKKRIIVNKNVTPMTARPDQCEITIENCCNMNICETPCFEPRNSIRPTLLDSKPGKEEKKNLIANMEYLEDY